VLIVPQFHLSYLLNACILEPRKQLKQQEVFLALKFGILLAEGRVRR
jgi:hypothetical protein